MAWVLVYLTVSLSGTQATEIDLYSSMIECFKARENLLSKINRTEHFPINEQAICIRTNRT